MDTSTTTGANRSRIRTPDQRLRVFVSSTLGDLVAERKAARRAIERLSAAPVMFELGARPHPPRSLYRAYLEQSDIFVGIYWQRYGWVAPGETVSGLEDEYNLAPAELPKLMYMKEADTAREPGLIALLNRIRDDDTASYKSFRDAGELARLLVTDLAVLLAERFDDSRRGSAESVRTLRGPSEESSSASSAAPSLPAPLTRLFGREDDVDRLTTTLRLPDVRLVTLLGPGGIGKTRLAIEAARALTGDFPEVTFVPLAPVDRAEQVPGAIAEAVGVGDTGDEPVAQKLTLGLSRRRILLVLDNFEQVVDAAPLVSTLLSQAPELKVLVTSRLLLRISGEHSYEVNALDLPASRVASWEPGQPLAASVELFIERARSVKPDLDVSDVNMRAIESIVAELEGIPLAIELAAARTRLLTPPVLLERLGRQLAVLTGGSRDAPARQKTVRDTIEWSIHLLADEEREVLWRLGIFTGRFSLDAVEAVMEPGTDVLESLEALVDASLVRQLDRDGRTYFQLLATVREYATEQLEARGLIPQLRLRHAQHYLSWGLRLIALLLGPEQNSMRILLTDQLDNLRAAVRYLVVSRDWEQLADFAGSAFLYWWMLSGLGEVRMWMSELLRTAAEASDRARATALFFTALAMSMQEEWLSVPDAARESAALFTSIGDEPMAAMAETLASLATAGGSPAQLAEARKQVEVALPIVQEAGSYWWEEILLLYLGRLALFEGNSAGAMDPLNRMFDLGRGHHDDFGMTFCLYHLAWAQLMSGHPEQAGPLLSRMLDLSLELEYEQSVTYAFEGLVGVAGTIGDIERAGLLVGAAEASHVRTGMYDPPGGGYHRPVVTQMLASPGAPIFEKAVAEGRRLTLEQGIVVAREVAAEADPG